jgi:lipopolysaccharide exporter
MSDSLKIKTISGIGYNTAARGITFVLQAVASIVLARNLVSDDYGIVGFAMIFISFMDQFTDFGISSAVIQKQDIKEKELYTGFTLKFMFGFVVFGLSLALAPLAAIYFDNENVVSVIQLLALNFLISSMSFLPNALLTRRLDYKKLALLQIVTSVVTSVTAIIMAINGFKFWSIAVASLGSTIASVVVINAMEPVKIMFSFDKRAAKELFNFGKHLIFSGIIIFAIMNADNFIIGTVRGAAELGHYALAFNWGALISILMGSTIGSVLFPAFSKMQHDTNRIKQAYLKVLHYVAFFAIMANLGLLIISKEFLFFVLGDGSDKWMPALDAFRILCIYGILRAILEPVGSVIMSLGHTGLLLKSTVVVALFQLSFLYPAVKYYGIEGVAVVVLLSYSIQFLIYFPLLKKRINMKYNELLSAVKLPVIAAVLLLVIMGIAEEGNIFQFTMAHLWAKLIFCTASYVLIYGIISRWAIIKEAKSILTDLRT